MDNKLSTCKDIDKKNDFNNPIVTIITPVFNGSKYLELCIQSVLMQSYPNIEHVFADGGSTDGTIEILSKYHSLYPDKIRFISKPDKGIGDAMNTCIRMANGEIFAFLGSDDMSEPDAILNVVEFFRSNPDAYFVYGTCNYINEKNEVILKVATKDFILDEILNTGNYVPCPSSFYRREVIENIGFYDTKGSDLDFLIRIAKVYKMYRIDKVLSNFRVHAGSSTTGASKKIQIMWLRHNYFDSLKHGGRIFSYYGKRYYMAVIIEPLLPIIKPIYICIKRINKVIMRDTK